MEVNNDKNYDHDEIEPEDFFANFYPNTPDKRSKIDGSLQSTPYQPPSISNSLLPSPFPLGAQSVLGSPMLDFSSGYSRYFTYSTKPLANILFIYCLNIDFRDWGDYLARSPQTMSPDFVGSKQKRERKAGIGQRMILKGSSSANAKSALSEVLSERYNSII